jgi:PTH1 family peptidyl-tRNA hydrolase
MKLIFGLGNPEPEHTFERHNVGKDVLNEYVNQKFNEPKWKNKSDWHCDYIDITDSTLAVKPTLYMNDAGLAISKISKYYKVPPHDILIIYDELDLVVGEYKIGHAKGSRIHNGIVSINEHLNSTNFWHLRIGVRDSHIESSVQKTGRNPAEYVLSKFNMTDKKKISDLVKSSLITEINNWLS